MMTHDTDLAKLAELVDRQAIADLIHRLGAVLDEQRFDDLRSLFTDDASITTPGGHARGVDAVVAQARRNHNPEVRTQHLATDLVVDLDGDRALARANFVGIFAAGEGSPAPAPQYRLGLVYRFELTSTPAGWRMRSMEQRPVWAAGERP
jgi:hypothetical protein